MHNSLKKRKITAGMILIPAVILFMAGIIIFLVKHNTEKETVSEDVSVEDDYGDEEEVIYYNGEEYVLNPDIDTLLIMGLDKYEDQIEEQSGYTNDQQADLIMVMVTDRNTGTCKALQLNRDTMCEMEFVSSSTGESGDTITAQLALAHTYGSGGSDSCIREKNAVEDLLYGVDIDHYLAISMDAVSIINDAVGGVTLTCMDDMTMIDPSLVKDTEVTLTGDLSLAYVRARSELSDNTNLHRMERQRQYMAALQSKLAAYLDENPNGAADLVLQINDYIQSDLSASQLQKYFEESTSLAEEDILTTSGENVQGSVYMEFYPDEDDLQQKVIELFYKKNE